VNRLGWTILLLVLLAGGAFFLMLSPGSAPSPDATAETAAGSAVAEPAELWRADPSGFVIPVAGVAPAQLVDTWGQSRAGGDRAHQAIDIMAPLGTAVVAARSGEVEKLFDSAAGGHTIYIRTADGGYVDYYAHLDGYAAGLREGQAVQQGQTIATVGSTGNARPEGPHLHFEVKRMAPGDRWHEGEPLNPYPLLAGTRGGS
jgi:murein DD-endopeptidase MepM/ murein hydrolase activator NlpD